MGIYEIEDKYFYQNTLRNIGKDSLIIRDENSNTKDENNAIINYYQYGLENPENSTKLKLILTFI